MTTGGPELRELVASVVREMVGDLVQDAVREAAVRQAAPSAARTHGPGRQLVTVPGQRGRTEAVRITDDADLDRFARHLLELFENPKNRQDLKSGRLRFCLGNPASRSDGGSGPATRIERGAVTERQVKAAADSGQRLILGPRAVLTPLGREKAKALDVHIEKERSC